MPTSNASEPRFTAAQSPDTLPLRGYTMSQLSNFIIRQLGGPTWNIELTNQQILDSIQDALGLYSQWVPNIKVGNIRLERGQHRYLQGVDVGLGVVQVDFVESSPVPADVFYLGMISPAPLGPIFNTGMDNYDMFLRWRKTWMRVTSCQPDWFYDEMEQVLLIHNPIERYHAGIFCYWPHTCTERLDYTGADWVKRFALAKSQLLLGNQWMKFSGAIPGPVKDLQLDTGRRDKAQEEIDKLMLQLKGMMRAAPAMID